MTGDLKVPVYRSRRMVVAGLLGLAFLSLLARAVDLQVFNQGFLQDQADARHLRVVSIAAHRGMILDRRGQPLAVSTPVDSVWANPQALAPARQHLSALSTLLDMDVDQLQHTLAERSDREFVYLKRHISPELSERVKAVGAPGVFLDREYRRYYPDGEVAAHIVGFTDIDDVGQEGTELAYDEWMRGEPGAKRVIKDGRHHVVADVESIRPPRPGKQLTLSIDRRLQYLAYRELKTAVVQHKARSGSVVMLDVQTGEVLAMVNQPSYNPNNRRGLRSGAIRNRAVTDVIEPGSTIKPFTIASALESGHYGPHSPIETAPGYFRVGRKTIRDVHDYGALDVTGVIRKSSNVGAAKIALSLPKEAFWSLLNRVGFGSLTASGFPGEVSGLLLNPGRWHRIEQATLAFGYGLSVTALQLAQAYGTLAADGVHHPASFLKLDKVPRGERILSASVARQVRAMLEEATGPDGTGGRARVSGYRVAGKTGTVHKSIAGGYAEDRYLSLFSGMAPASRPRLVLVVVINEPSNGDHYGGEVAAPVFSRVMAGALRLLDIAPDDLQRSVQRAVVENPA